MAPVQQKFQVIPALPSALNGGGGVAPGDLPPARPPMTTKQAKKEYKAKNKGPKLSKAEQRRQDLMEQDRIRRELEKDRSQARARAARDKRREKEDREKSEKRRKGLPLVEVHPSQDTISRFIRRAPAPRPDKPEHRQEQAQRPVAEPKGGSSKEEDANDAKEVSIPADVPVAQPQTREGSGKASPATGEEDGERPAKRQRITASPSTGSGPDQIPGGMFKGPKPGSVIQGIPLVSEVSGDGAVGEPAVVKSTNQQIRTESFSIEDGFFDDIDLDAIDAKIEPKSLQQSASPVEPSRPLAKPPDAMQAPVQRDLSTRDQPVQEQSQTDKIHTELIVVATAASTRAASPLGVRTSKNISGSRTPAASDVPTQNSLLDNSNALQNEARPNKAQTHAPERAHPDAMKGPPAGDTIQPARLSREPVEASKDSRDAVQALARPPSRAFNTPQQQQQQSKQNSHHPSGAAKRAPELSGIDGNQGRRALKELPSNQSKDLKSKGGMESRNTSPNDQPLKEGALDPQFRKPQIPLQRPEVFRPPKTPMGPPPLPPKFKTPEHPHPPRESRGPKFLPQRRSDTAGEARSKISVSPASLSDSKPPTSTQAFLLSHVDDLFPSPSQEAQEIFENPRAELPRNPPRPKTAPPPRRFLPPPPTRGVSGEAPKPPRAASAKPSRNTAQMPMAPAQFSARTAPGMPKPRAHPESPHRSNMDVMSFISTQDIMLSSQDIQELEEETPAPKEPTLVSKRWSAGTPLRRVSEVAEHSACGQRYLSMDVRKPANETPSRAHPPSRPADMNTVDRILGPGFHSQQSSSLPDTPSVPRSRVAVVPHARRDTAGNIAKGKDKRGHSSTPVTGLLDEDLTALLCDEDQETGLQGVGGHEQMTAKEMPCTAKQGIPPVKPPSPKRFFTSSGMKERIYLALERSKPSAWLDDRERLRHQEELELLFNKAEEKAERARIEKMLEEEARQYDQELVIPSSHAPSSGRKRSQSQRSQGGSQQSRRRSQPQSSYEKMLELANSSAGREDIIPASQESNYSDVAWDDDLINLCS